MTAMVAEVSPSTLVDDRLVTPPVTLNITPPPVYGANGSSGAVSGRFVYAGFFIIAHCSRLVMTRSISPRRP